MTDVPGSPNALPYVDVVEVQKRVKTIISIQDLADDLAIAKVNWQGKLGDLKGKVSSSSDAGDRPELTAKVQEENRAFLAKVDTVLHHMCFAADIWGEGEKKNRRIQEKDEEISRLSSLLGGDTRRPVDVSVSTPMGYSTPIGHSTPAGRTPSIARDDGRLRELEGQVSALEQQLASERANLHVVRAELEQTNGILDKTKRSSSQKTVENERLDNEVVDLQGRLDKEQDLRAQVAQECAEVHIELTHATEMIESERIANGKLHQEVERLRRLLDELNAKSELQAREEGAPPKTELITLKVKIAELERKHELHTEEKAKAEQQVAAATAALKEAQKSAASSRAELEGDLRVLKGENSSLASKNADLRKSNELVFQEIDMMHQDRTDADTIHELRVLVDEAAKRQAVGDSENAALKFAAETAEAEAANAREMLEAAKASFKQTLDEERKTRDSLLDNITILKSELESMRIRVHDDTADALRLQAKVSSQDSNAAEQKGLIAVLRAEKAILKTEIAEYQAELEREIHQHALTKEECDICKHEAATWKTRCHREEHTIASLQEAQKAHAHAEAQLETRLSGMAVEQARLSHQLEDVKKALAREQAARDTAEFEERRAKEELVAIQEKFEEERRRLSEDEEELAGLRKSLQLQEFERARVVDKLDETNTMVTGVQDVVESLNSSKIQQEQEIFALRNKAGNDERERVELSLVLRDLERDNLQLRDGLDDAEASYEALHRDLGVTQRALDAERIEKKSLQATLAKSKENFQTLCRELAELQDAKALTEADLTHTRHRLHTLLTEKAELRRELDRQESKIEDQKRLLDELSMKTEVSQHELQKSQDLVKADARGRAEFQLRKIALDQELADAQIRLSKAEQREEQVIKEWRAETNRLEEELLRLELAHQDARTKAEDNIKKLQDEMTALVAANHQKLHSFEEEVSRQQRELHAAHVREEEAAKSLLDSTVELEKANNRIVEETLAREAADGVAASMDTKNTKLSAQNSALLEEVSDLHAEYGDMQSLRQKLVEENLQLEERNEKVKTLLLETEGLAEELREQIRLLNQNIADLDQEKNAALLEVDRINSKLEAEHTEREHAEARVETLRGKVEEVEQENAALSTAAESDRAMAATYQEKVAEVMAERSQLVADRDQAAADLERTVGEVEELRKIKADLKKEKALALQEVEDVQGKLDREEVLREKAEAVRVADAHSIASLKQTVRDLQAEQITIKRELNLAQQQYDDAAAQAERFKKKYTDERLATQAVEQQVEDYKTQLRDEVIAKRELQRQVEVLRVKVDELSSKKAELGRELQQALAAEEVQARAAAKAGRELAEAERLRDETVADLSNQLQTAEGKGAAAQAEAERQEEAAGTERRRAMQEESRRIQVSRERDDTKIRLAAAEEAQHVAELERARVMKELERVQEQHEKEVNRLTARATKDEERIEELRREAEDIRARSLELKRMKDKLEEELEGTKSQLDRELRAEQKRADQATSELLLEQKRETAAKVGYEAAVRDKEAAVADLVAARNELQDERLRKNEAADQIGKQLEEALGKLAEAQDAQSEAEAALAHEKELREKAEEAAEQRSKTLEDELEERQRTAFKAVGDGRRAQAEAETLATELASAKDDLKTMQEANRALEDRCAAAERVRDDKDTSADHANAQSSLLRERVAALEGKESTLEERNAQLEGEQKDIQDRLDAVLREVGELQSAAVDSDTEIAQLQELCKDWETRAKHAQEASEDAKRRAEELQRDLDDANKIAEEDLKAATAELTQRVRELDVGASEAQGREKSLVKELEGRVKQANDVRDEQEAALADSRKELEATRAKCANSQRAQRDSEEEASVLRRELQKAKDALDLEDPRIAQLREQVTEEQSRREAVEDSLAEERERRRRAESLRDERDHSRLDKTEAERDAAKAHVRELERDLERAKNSAMQAEDRERRALRDLERAKAQASAAEADAERRGNLTDQIRQRREEGALEATSAALAQQRAEDLQRRNGELRAQAEKDRDIIGGLKQKLAAARSSPGGASPLSSPSAASSSSQKNMVAYKKEILKLRAEREDEIKARLDLLAQARRVQQKNAKLTAELKDMTNAYHRLEEKFNSDLQSMEDGEKIRLMVAQSEDAKQALEKARRELAEARHQNRTDSDKIKRLEHHVRELSTQAPSGRSPRTPARSSPSPQRESSIEYMGDYDLEKMLADTEARAARLEANMR